MSETNEKKPPVGGDVCQSGVLANHQEAAQSGAAQGGLRQGASVELEICSMNELDLAEYNSREAAAFSLDGLAQARTKAHQLLVLLLGGGAGLLAYGVANMSTSPLQSYVAMFVSLAWFCLAMYLAVWGLRSSGVVSWASTCVLEKHKEWQRYSQELKAEGCPDEVDPLEMLRRQLVELRVSAIGGYRAAANRAHGAIDAAYVGAAASPVFGALVALIVFASR